MNISGRLVRLYSKYAGRSVLFLGTGTSLLDYDLEKIDKSIYTFGFNNFVPFYKSFWPEMKLDFQMVHDSKVFQVPFRKYHNTRNKNEHQTYGFELETVGELGDISPAKYILDNKLYEDTKIIFCENIIQERIHRMFDAQTNREWVASNKEIIENNDNFLLYYIKENNKENYLMFVENDCDVYVPVWAKNSFCNSAVPMLFFLGFSEIYLAGVDYSNEGYFFCRIDENKRQEILYTDKEKEQFEGLMKTAEEGVSHKPKIYSIKNDKTKICAKDGWKDIEELYAK